ncbi:MAG: TIGR04255 family protein [Gammaproteobacteria bacterium]|nr:TIGR04255 family protein [Gammaproteobacteria bacterium]
MAIVLAQVRFEPFPGMSPDDLLAAFHPVIMADFPQVSPIHQFAIFFGAAHLDQSPPSPPVLGYDLISDDATRVVRIQSGVLTYTVTSYHDYQRFSAEWGRILSALCAIDEIKGLRLGLRYVDFIIPSDGLVPEDYVVAPIGLSPPSLGDASPVVLNLFEYPRENGQLRIQYGRGFGPPDYPPDLQGMVIPPSGLQARYSAGPSAVLDMDRWVEFPPATMPLTEFSQYFLDMHDDMSLAFRLIITPEALSEWGGNKGNEGE